VYVNALLNGHYSCTSILGTLNGTAMKVTFILMMQLLLLLLLLL
jgi:hypothetical protein